MLAFNVQQVDYTKITVHLVGNSGTSSDLAVSLLDLVSLLERSSVGAELRLDRKNESKSDLNEEKQYNVCAHKKLYPRALDVII